MGDEPIKRILDIWEYFVRLLPEDEYDRLKSFIQGWYFYKIGNT